MTGPVQNGKVTCSGFSWTCDEDLLAKSVPGLKGVHLTNDLLATAEIICTTIKRHQVVNIRNGERDKKGLVAVLGVSTGVGMASLQKIDGSWTVQPSEGGHALFAPASNLQLDILRWHLDTYGAPPTVEEVMGGRGLPTLYAFFAQHAGLQDAVRLTEAPDFGSAILAAAADPAKNPCSAATVIEMARMILVEAGNLALRTMATRGVFLCGTFPARLLPHLTDPRLAPAFVGPSSGVVRPLLERIPVLVVREDYAAAIGVTQMAQHRFNDEFALVGQP